MIVVDAHPHAQLRSDIPFFPPPFPRGTNTALSPSIPPFTVFPSFCVLQEENTKQLTYISIYPNEEVFHPKKEAIVHERPQRLPYRPALYRFFLSGHCVCR